MNDTESQKLASLAKKLMIKEQLQKRKKLFIFVLGILVMLILFFLMLTREKLALSLEESQAIRQQATLSQVMQMKNQLNEIKNKESNAPSEQDLKNVTQGMTLMQSSLARWQNQLLNEIENLLTIDNQSLTARLIQLQTSVQQLTKQITPQHYLPASALTFKVKSIDIWNGQAMATVTLGGYSDLMAKNDTRNGWTLIDLSFDPARAIFKNNKNQLVKVNF